MDCIARRPLKSSRFSVLAIAFFVMFLALQPGYSESNTASPVPIVETGTAPAVVIPFRPFSSLAIGLAFGSYGPTVQLATPLSIRSNLRVDGSFFNLGLSPERSGVNYNGTLNIREVRGSYDFFPFHGSFRLSAGVAVYNDLNLDGAGTVAANKSISLNDVHYFNGVASPLAAKVTFTYPTKVAPTFTLGWGNAIPRTGGRLAFPVEIGAAYYGTPQFTLNVTGSACVSALCTPSNPGTPVASIPGFTANLNAERARVVNDIAPLRFYPIVNCGVTYRF